MVYYFRILNHKGVPMKLTCTVVPESERTVVFSEARALYSWTVYDLTVVAEAFRGAASEARVELTRDGRTYASAALVPDPARANVRVGALSLTNPMFADLFSDAAANGRVCELDFGFAVTSSDGVAIANDTVPVVVTDRADLAVQPVVVDAALDEGSDNPVRNAAIAKEFASLGVEAASAVSVSGEARAAAGSALLRVAALETRVDNLALTVSDDVKAAVAALAKLDAGSEGSDVVSTVNGIVEVLRKVADGGIGGS